MTPTHLYLCKCGKVVNARGQVVTVPFWKRDYIKQPSVCNECLEKELDHLDSEMTRLGEGKGTK